MEKHYTIVIPGADHDYVDGIMAESLEDAVKKFHDCLETGLSLEELSNCVTQE